ncbi:hypothetical protein MPLB_2300001 [Mesorhizobium sp. ORS 3324]|nr:hypothetical protein MPLB_2300001 [Mesorhizobium sp. ORS 3324]
MSDSSRRSAEPFLRHGGAMIVRPFSIVSVRTPHRHTLAAVLNLRVTENDGPVVLTDFNAHDPIVGLTGLEHGDRIVSGSLFSVEGYLVDDALLIVPDDCVGHCWLHAFALEHIGVQQAAGKEWSARQAKEKVPVTDSGRRPGFVCNASEPGSLKERSLVTLLMPHKRTFK